MQKWKNEYYRIRAVTCPAFYNELVCFNERGFNHLLMKNTAYRTYKDQLRRFRLLKKAAGIIRSSKTYFELRHFDKIDFYSLMERKGNKEITVVLRRMERGKLEFYSVMDKKLHKHTNPSRGSSSCSLSASVPD